MKAANGGKSTKKELSPAVVVVVIIVVVLVIIAGFSVLHKGKKPAAGGIPTDPKAMSGMKVFGKNSSPQDAQRTQEGGSSGGLATPGGSQ